MPLTVRASGMAPPCRADQPAGRRGRPGRDAGRRRAAGGGTKKSASIRATVRVLGELTPVHVIVSGFTLHPDRRRDRRAAGLRAGAERKSKRCSRCRSRRLRDASTNPAWHPDPRRRRHRVPLLRSPRAPGLGRHGDGARGAHLPARGRAAALKASPTCSAAASRGGTASWRRSPWELRLARPRRSPPR